MTRRFKLILVLLLFSTGLYCQVDSIHVQIMSYEESKSTIISKGCALILDKFLEGDLGKVKRSRIT